MSIPTNPPSPPDIGHREFLELALASAGEWTRYADPKALGVLVVLGLGMGDLVEHAGRFVEPHEASTARCAVIGVTGHSCAGIAATTVFAVAVLVAALTVLAITSALFSQLSLRGLLSGETTDDLPKSHFYFGQVARFGSQQAYRVSVLNQKPHQLLDDLAGQVYEVSLIGARKHRAVQRAYVLVVAFLVLWVIGRVLLAGAT